MFKPLGLAVCFVQRCSESAGVEVSATFHLNNGLSLILTAGVCGSVSSVRSKGFVRSSE